MTAEVCRWVVWRQDDNGNRYEVARFDDQAEAQASADSLEAAGHRQIYWIAPAEKQAPA
jgi:DNA-binding LacI/PurR family transcriptional regulator